MKAFIHLALILCTLGALTPAPAAVPRPEISLGQLVDHDGSFHSMMILDPSTSTVKYVPSPTLKNIPGAQPVLHLYAQQGGTCTGYALDDFILQTHFSGFTGNGKLSSQLADEEGRTALLVDAVNQYYLVLQHRFSILGILNGYGKKYGFSCRKKVFTDVTSARGHMVESLKSGMPVMIAFNIGTGMNDGPFKLQNLASPTVPEDVRLWLPRKIGQRNSGGHAIVATGSFSWNGADYAVVLDSDWGLPRVWNLEDAFSDATAIAEVEFYTCQ
jgi:hypothetical protein